MTKIPPTQEESVIGTREGALRQVPWEVGLSVGLLLLNTGFIGAALLHPGWSFPKAGWAIPAIGVPLLGAVGLARRTRWGWSLVFAISLLALGAYLFWIGFEAVTEGVGASAGAAFWGSPLGTMWGAILWLLLRVRSRPP